MINVAVPPVHEQNIIIERIDDFFYKLDKIIYAVHREISSVREYRTRLIADVVTGKVDVRDIAASLPDLDEADILEEAVLDDEVVDTEEAELSEEGTDADE